MAKCVMCEKEVNGYYDYEGAKIPVCFEHYKDGTFANYLAAQQGVRSNGALPSYNCECGFIVAIGETECMRCHTPRR
jgi:hypothetical protein